MLCCCHDRHTSEHSKTTLYDACKGHPFLPTLAVPCLADLSSLSQAARMLSHAHLAAAFDRTSFGVFGILVLVLGRHTHRRVLAISQVPNAARAFWPRCMKDPHLQIELQSCSTMLHSRQSLPGVDTNAFHPETSIELVEGHKLGEKLLPRPHSA